MMKRKIYIQILLIVTIGLFVIGHPTTLFAQNDDYNNGVILLPNSEYEKLPKVDWEGIRNNVNSGTISRDSKNGVVMLLSPTAGNQGSNGSCVGWAVGYAASSILAYPKYNNWSTASRSPSYIYNQIKYGSSCKVGTSVYQALNLVKDQGVCSYELMPYVIDNCNTQPNTNQKYNAYNNRIAKWGTLQKNDISGIKKALYEGCPVVIAFVVTQSYKNIWQTKYIWDYNIITGDEISSHATCIIGYDDTKQMFKVQDSYGPSRGINGCFWVTYDLVKNNCLNEVYVLSGYNYSSQTPISGPSTICTSNKVYSLNSLPPSSTISWSTTPNITIISGQGTDNLTVKANGNGAGTITATISVNGANPIAITKNIWVGTPIVNSHAQSMGEFDITEFCQSYYYSAENELMINADGITSVLMSSSNYEWNIVSNNFGYHTFGNRISIQPYKLGYIDFSVKAKNECGWSDFEDFEFPVIKCGSTNPNMMLSPNPVRNCVEIELLEPIEDTIDTEMRKSYVKLEKGSLTITNSFGLVVKSQVFNGNKMSINVDNLSKGLYTATIIKGNKKYSTKFIKQ